MAKYNYRDIYSYVSLDLEKQAAAKLDAALASGLQ
jgi:hypothetical protein